jgi:hypothetical protein
MKMSENKRLAPVGLYEIAKDKTENAEIEEVAFMSDAEIEAYICQLEQELGLSRADFLKRVDDGTEPDTFAAMALKTLLLH